MQLYSHRCKNGCLPSLVHSASFVLRKKPVSYLQISVVIHN